MRTVHHHCVIVLGQDTAAPKILIIHAAAQTRFLVPSLLAEEYDRHDEYADLTKIRPRRAQKCESYILPAAQGLCVVIILSIHYVQLYKNPSHRYNMPMTHP